MKSNSFSRLAAIIRKEFIQMRRDKPTIGMIVIIPLMQLILFGYAINTNPRYLPTAVIEAEHSVFTRRILTAMEQSTYFRITHPAVSEYEAKELLQTGKVQFVVNFPVDFSHDLVKGLKPQLLLEADASDPSANTQAFAVFQALPSLVLQEELRGALSPLAAKLPPYQAAIYAHYNPLAITTYNIVPGLLGVILTMTMVMITALAITREYERGTMENLLATPLLPIEVMIGKLIPYVIVGYIQVLLILVMAKLLFNIPIEGSISLLLILCLPFIIANLAVGLTCSTLASNQLQAVQSGVFFFLPSILLSGFMFPFRGMPEWAQWLGNLLPLTHFLVIVRGILLKGNDFSTLLREVIPLLLFTLVVMTIAFKRYRKTLD